MIFSQTPVLTSKNFFEVGKKYIRYGYDVNISEAFAGAEGENTWEFTHFDIDILYIDTLTVIEPSTTPFYPDTSVNYYLSNLCYKIDTEQGSSSDEDYYFYIHSDTSLKFLGNWRLNRLNNFWHFHYDDPMTKLKYPFNYNESFSDSFSGSYMDVSGQGTTYLKGKTHVTYDAYGKIITESLDTIKNVIRIKEITSLKDSNFYFGVSSAIDTSYYWYSDKYDRILYQFIVKRGRTYMVYKYLPLINTAVQNTNEINNQDDIKFDIYPNPIKSGAVLNGKMKEPVTIIIYNCLGQQLKVFNDIRLPHNIILGDLSNGFYLYQILTGNKLLYTNKFLIIK